MENNPIGNETGLVAYWPVEPNSSNSLLDLSSNNNHGIIHGATWIEIIEKIERNQVMTLSKNSNVLQYNRLIKEGEEADLTLISINLTSMPNPNNGNMPSISFISISIGLIFAAHLRKKE